MKTLILAGTMRGADALREELGLSRSDCIRITRPDHLRGMATKGMPRDFTPCFFDGGRKSWDILNALDITDLNTGRKD